MRCAMSLERRRTETPAHDWQSPRPCILNLPLPAAVLGGQSQHSRRVSAFEKVTGNFETRRQLAACVDHDSQGCCPTHGAPGCSRSPVLRSLNGSRRCARGHPRTAPGRARDDAGRRDAANVARPRCRGRRGARAGQHPGDRGQDPQSPPGSAVVVVCAARRILRPLGASRRPRGDRLPAGGDGRPGGLLPAGRGRRFGWSTTSTARTPTSRSPSRSTGSPWRSTSARSTPAGCVKPSPRTSLRRVAATGSLPVGSSA